MDYHFTFKTDDDLRKAEMSGFDDTFDIVRVNFKYPGDNTIYGIPLKTEEQYNNFLTNRIPNEKLTVEKFYQDKHGFEHGKYDYLNDMDENKKPMKNKMTLKEFKEYVKNEAQKLFKVATLKEEKERLEKELSTLNENFLPTELASAFTDPETLKLVRQELLKKAAGWATPEPAQLLPEWDKKAMQAAKADIEASGEKFTPLGKSKFEKHLDKKELNKAMSPEAEKNLEEKKYSTDASEFIGKEIGHLQKDKDYPHDRAVAAAINVARDKGYKVPPAKNEVSQVFAGTDVTNPEAKMYFFKIHHDNGVDKLKIADFSKENAQKVIAKFMNAPESAVEFVKEEPVKAKKAYTSENLNEWPEEVKKGRFTDYCKRNGHPGGASIECAKQAMDSDDASVRGMATFYMNTVKPKGKDASDLEESPDPMNDSSSIQGNK